MSGPADSPRQPAPESLWRRLGWPTVASAAVTTTLGCSVLFGALRVDVLPAVASVMMLFAVTAWVALAAGPMAAGGRDTLGALGRAGVLADAGVAPLLAAGAWGGGAITWATGLEVYLLWATLAVSIALLVRLGRTPLTRGAWAMGVSVGAMLAVSSLFWSAGLLSTVREPTRTPVVTAVLAPNVAHSAAQVVGYTWSEKGRIYDSITRLGQDFPAPHVPWWSPAACWGVPGVLAGGVLAWRTHRRRPPQQM